MKKKILDCTLRDGGYINNWRFTEQFVDQFVDFMSKTGVDYIELGFLNKTANYAGKIVGKWRNLNQETVTKYHDRKTKIAVMVDHGDIDFEKLKELKQNQVKIDLVRVAFHKKDLENALKECKLLKELGYQISANAMAITNYTDDDLKVLFNYVNEFELDILYVADSYGSLNQSQIENYLNVFSKSLNEHTAIGFHLHNNKNNAFSNYEYLNKLTSNRTIFIDTTLYGMGRGAGNLQTELVLIDLGYLRTVSSIIELLSLIQTSIKPIFKQNETTWGYDLDYLLSGHFGIHPNYVVKMRELNIDMIKRFFLLELLIETGNHTYFKVGTLENLIEKYKTLLL